MADHYYVESAANFPREVRALAPEDSTSDFALKDP